MLHSLASFFPKTFYYYALLRLIVITLYCLSISSSFLATLFWWNELFILPNYFLLLLFFLFFAPCSVVFKAYSWLCSGISPGRALGTIWSAQDQYCIGHMQDKCDTTVLLLRPLFLFLLSWLFNVSQSPPIMTCLFYHVYLLNIIISWLSEKLSSQITFLEAQNKVAESDKELGEVSNVFLKY